MSEPPRDIPVRMVRPHLDNIPKAAFPEGFGIRTLRRDEGPLWTDVQRDAEEILTIQDDLFARQFGDDPEGIEQRCFFITNPKGAAVGTISAWYKRDTPGEDVGRVHWVAVRPTYQGRGLARAGLAYTLRRLAQWHSSALLDTSTLRLPALKLYLDFGFVPDLDSPDAVAAWRAVGAVLNHPALSALAP